PAPTRILEGLWRGRDVISHHAWVTLKVTLYGLGVALMLGVTLALLIDAFAPVRRAVYPLVVGSQTIPIVVIAPLLVLWFGFVLATQIMVAALCTVCPVRR